MALPPIPPMNDDGKLVDFIKDGRPKPFNEQWHRVRLVEIVRIMEKARVLLISERAVFREEILLEYLVRLSLCQLLTLEVKNISIVCLHADFVKEMKREPQDVTDILEFIKQFENRYRKQKLK